MKEGCTAHDLPIFRRLQSFSVGKSMTAGLLVVLHHPHINIHKGRNECRVGSRQELHVYRNESDETYGPFIEISQAHMRRGTELR